MSPLSPPRALSLALLTLSGLSCGDRPAPPSTAVAPDAAGSAQGAPRPPADGPFFRIRALLEQDPESSERATRLAPLVLPLCSDGARRRAFLEAAAWSASFSDRDLRLTEVLAAEVIEHVATVCLRLDAPVAFELIAGGKEAVPGQGARFAVIEARLLAASGDLAAARVAAEEARRLGSVHAIALLANVQAEEARAAGVGYRAGMLDPALATVSVEPEASWQLIDLTAVLSTRARLLTERALWEGPEAAALTRLQAGSTYLRLAVAPFPEATRIRARDVACFDAIDLGQGVAASCALAAEVGGLGAAAATGAATPPERFDLARRARLEKLREDLAGPPGRGTVLVVARGDEAELVEWARPAAVFLGGLGARGARVVAIDRTSSPRASAMFARVLELASVKPVVSIAGGRDPLVVPCAAAVLSERRTPASCPIAPASLAALEKAGPAGLAVLFGRDLDAEIDDLRVYEKRTVLLSFRTSQHEKHVDAWLKSLPDVFVVWPERAGRGAP